MGVGPRGICARQHTDGERSPASKVWIVADPDLTRPDLTRPVCALTRASKLPDTVSAPSQLLWVAIEDPSASALERNTVFHVGKHGNEHCGSFRFGADLRHRIDLFMHELRFSTSQKILTGGRHCVFSTRYSML